MGGPPPRASSELDLERDGLVVRPGEAPVGRVLPVRLTAQGRRSLAKASAAVRSVETRMLGGMTPAEQEDAFRLLASMVRSLKDDADRR